MRQKSSASQNLRAAQVGFFCQCACAHCRYTQHIHTAYLSHVEISLKVKTFLKKTYSRILLEQNYTVHIFIKTRSNTSVGLISGRFQEVACDSYCVLTKAVSQYCVAWIALLPRHCCSKANAQWIQLTKHIQ